MPKKCHVLFAWPLMLFLGFSVLVNVVTVCTISFRSVCLCLLFQDTCRFYKYVTDADKLTKINIVTKELFELRSLIKNVKVKWFKNNKFNKCKFLFEIQLNLVIMNESNSAIRVLNDIFTTKKFRVTIRFITNFFCF